MSVVSTKSVSWYKLGSSVHFNPQDLKSEKLFQFFAEKHHSIIIEKKRLTLTAAMLRIVNEIIYRYKRKYVISTHNMLSSSDAEFIWNFMKNVRNFKVVQQDKYLKSAVDIRCLALVKNIEFHSVPLHLVIGLKELSKNLETLIITHSVFNLRDLLSTTKSFHTDQKWIRLHNLVLRNDHLSYLGSVIQNIPNIRVLDASFNEITNADNMYLLKHMTVLNLGFNQIGRFPIFSYNKNAHSSLRTLILRNNFLENLVGIEKLVHLSDLDVRNNCLMSCRTFGRIRQLTSLRTLLIEGNPFTYDKQHRLKLQQYFHKDVIREEVKVDGTLLFTNREEHNGDPFSRDDT